MGNIFDYMEWRGDLTFDKDPFNKIDAVMVSLLALIDFRGIIDGKKTIKEAFDKYIELGNNPKNPLGLVITNMPCLMFEKMAKLPRYKDLVLSDLEYVFNKKKPIQFQAFLLEINKEEAIISFSPTDDSICGWHEDLLMVNSDVYSYEVAVKYTKKILKETNYNLYLNGQSKGGAISMYTCLNIDSNRIIKAYNFDGPGFKKVDPSNPNWTKIETYQPQKSTIGRLLFNESKQFIVKCRADIFRSHDPFEWVIERNDFVYGSHYFDESVYLDYKVKTLIDSLDDEEISMIVNAVPKWLYSCNSECLLDLKKNRLKIIPYLNKLDKTERKLIDKYVIRYFVNDDNFKRIMINSFFKKDGLKMKKMEKYQK